MRVFHWCVCAVLMLSLTGCATRSLGIVEEKGFQDMARHLRAELQARGLFDAQGAFHTRSVDAQFPYERILYNQLSPMFMTEDTVNHVYLGETFRATLTPKSRLGWIGHGFRIQHATQRVTVRMLAIADWDGDKSDEWLVSCLVEPRRGGRTRTYYLLVPPPQSTHDVVPATIAATYDCKGLACTLNVRKVTEIPRSTEDKLATPVQDVTPGLGNVTEAPRKQATPSSGLEERSL